MVTLDVVNMVGQTAMFVSNTHQEAGSIEVQLNTTSLNEGFYFLRIQTANGTEVLKFSVVH